MFTTAKNLLLAAAILAPAALTLNAHAQSGNETFRVDNQTTWRIDHIYMTRSSDNGWGTDRLYGYLQPNYHLDIPVDPGRYDIRIVDKDNDVCVVKHIDVFEGKIFHLTSQVLVTCEVLSR